MQRRSILDVVDRTHQRALTRRLGPPDRRKIDEYLTADPRDRAADRDGGAGQREVTPDIEKPSGIPADFADYVKMMFDLQVLAFQADLTRVSTLVIGREGSLRTYPEIGVRDPHHPLTHHRNNPE